MKVTVAYLSFQPPLLCRFGDSTVRAWEMRHGPLVLWAVNRVLPLDAHGDTKDRTRWERGERSSIRFKGEERATQHIFRQFFLFRIQRM